MNKQIFPFFCNNHKTLKFWTKTYIVVDIRFENWGISIGNIRPRDAFRPIAREQKDLMDPKKSSP